MLLGMVKKPPEYFEATYNLAAALYGQASAAKDKTQAAEKAKQAEQLLKSTLILSPDLSGPEMVEQYNALLKKASALHERLEFEITDDDIQADINMSFAYWLLSHR